MDIIDICQNEVSILHPIKIKSPHATLAEDRVKLVEDINPAIGIDRKVHNALIAIW